MLTSNIITLLGVSQTYDFELAKDVQGEAGTSGYVVAPQVYSKRKFMMRFYYHPHQKTWFQFSVLFNWQSFNSLRVYKISQH